MTLVLPPRTVDASTTPTLGYLVRAWLQWHLPSPRNERQRLELAPWQKSRILRWYELDEAGKRRWHRCHDEDPKGKGKSPLAAAVDIVEFRGPVVFSGFAKGGEVYDCLDHACSCGWGYEYEPGEPMGASWGSPGLPAPWVQVVAVSEKQTGNTWAALHYFLSANDKRLEHQLRLDAGRTLVYWRDRDDAKIERVTSSAGSRTGQPITHATMDEPQEWTPALRGPELATTVLANLTKLDGWAHFTGNAPVLGMGSVSEMLGYRYDDTARAWAAVDAPKVLQIRPRPSVQPTEDMTRDRLRPLVQEVYEGTPWTPVERILDDAADRMAYPWSETLRLFLNVPGDVRVAGSWMPAELWESAAGSVTFRHDLPLYVVVRISHDHRTAAMAAAQRQGEDVVVMSRVFAATGDDEYVPLGPLETALGALRASFKALVMTKVKFRPTGREYDRRLPGPEVSTHGAFLEGLAQRLRADGAVVVDLPSSRERLTPAAEAVKERLIEGALRHDGDAATARHMTSVAAKQDPRGWVVGAQDDADGKPQPIVAATAVMLAVHRAMTAPAAPKYRSRGIR